MTIIKRLWAMLTRRNLVVLVDEDGEKTVAIERCLMDGTKYAYRHSSMKIKVYLNDNGTTSGLSYVRRWEKL